MPGVPPGGQAEPTPPSGGEPPAANPSTPPGTKTP
jgi:hypothetical protein